MSPRRPYSFKRPLPRRDVAKRGKGEQPEEKDEGYDFVPPDFDEDSFIHKEMISFRTTSTLIVVGILAALISWAVYNPVGGADAGWWIGLAILGAMFAGLKPLYKVLKFDISHYGRREWIGTGFLMFFTWLAFFMILLNPPFSDHAEPHVDIYASPDVVAVGEMARIDLFIADNDKVSSFTFSIVDGNNATVATKADLSRLAHDHYRYEGELPPGSYTVRSSAKDPAKLEGSAELTFSVAERLLRVFPDGAKDLTDPTKEILVTVPADVNVWSVYADFDGDATTTGDRVYFQYAEQKSGYVATAAHKGWKQGINNVTIIVEERNEFHGQNLIPGAVIKAGPFEVDVDAPGSYDPKAPKGRQNTVAPMVNVPGIELPLLAAGLVAAALVARRK